MFKPRHDINIRDALRMWPKYIATCVTNCIEMDDRYVLKAYMHHTTNAAPVARYARSLWTPVFLPISTHVVMARLKSRHGLERQASVLKCIIHMALPPPSPVRCSWACATTLPCPLGPDPITDSPLSPSVPGPLLRAPIRLFLFCTCPPREPRLRTPDNPPKCMIFPR